MQQRKMKVVGFYHSGIDDYDKQFVFVDIKNLQQLNNNPNQVEGFGIYLKQNSNAQQTSDQIQAILPKNWVATTIDNYYPQIFDWI